MNYKTIRKNFEKGLWSEALVRTAVRKGLITEAECEEILSGREPAGGNIDEAMAILRGEVEA